MLHASNKKTGGKNSMKKFLEEFKSFALRGNVLDLAVGVIIGGAFQSIVSSLTNDIISPILGIAGKMDFTQFIFTINGSEIRYGSFITAVINFIIMAFIIFCLVKGINKLATMGKKEEPKKPTEPTTKKCPYCLSEIPIKATKCAHCTSHLEE